VGARRGARWLTPLPPLTPLADVSMLELWEEEEA
jgi:hypothetical protein